VGRTVFRAIFRGGEKVISDYLFHFLFSFSFKNSIFMKYFHEKVRSVHGTNSILVLSKTLSILEFFFDFFGFFFTFSGIVFNGAQYMRQGIG
jgi:hypothetical protein